MVVNLYTIRSYVVINEWDFHFCVHLCITKKDPFLTELSYCVF